MSDEEYAFIREVFSKYDKKFQDKNLYRVDDLTPTNLIRFYFDNPHHLTFAEIITNYRTKYIQNENDMENVHNKEERQGLGEVYNYIQSEKWRALPNIYILLQIHQLLYSKVPHPEGQGAFRNVNAYIKGSDIKTSPYEEIPKDIQSLYGDYQQLIEWANQIVQSKDNSSLIPYIDKCIDFKCRLIEIHPFPDGNGRTCRALLNILFRMVSIPPVYVKRSEKKQYIEAMDDAVRLKKYQKIHQFYYYKICDSIVELDIKKQENMNSQILPKSDVNLNYSNPTLKRTIPKSRT